MNAKTSFFNKKIFINNILQSLSIILIMFAFLALTGIGTINSTLEYLKFSGYSKATTAMVMQNAIMSTYCTGSVKVFFALYSFYCGVTVFRYLYNKKLCTTIHALPLTRNCMFITNVISGLTILILPFLANTLVLGIYLLIKSYGIGYLPILLIVSIGFCLIFFALAVLTAMLTGHNAATPVIYGFFNFGFIISKFMIQSFMSIFYFGMTPDVTNNHTILTPFLHLHYNLHLQDITETTIHYRDKGIEALIIYAIVSLLILAISCVLYNRRQLETYGEPIVTKKLEPVFLYIGTTLGSIILSLMLYGIIFYSESHNAVYPQGNSTIWVMILFILSSIILYYGITMLLKKTAKVFRSNYKGILVYCCIVIAAFVFIKTDVFKVETKLPKQADISTINLSIDGTKLVINESDAIEQLLKVHEEFITKKDTIISATNDYYKRNNAYCTISFTYKLKNGKTFIRNYDIPFNPLYETSNSLNKDMTELLNTTSAIINNPSVIQTNFQTSAPKVHEIYIGIPVEDKKDGSVYTEELVVPYGQFDTLLQALEKDIQEGHVQYYFYEESTSESYYYLNMWINNNNDPTISSVMDYKITPECTHTIAVIEELIHQYQFDDVTPIQIQ